MGAGRAEMHYVLYFSFIHLAGVMKGVVVVPAGRVDHCEKPVRHHAVAHFTDFCGSVVINSKSMFSQNGVAR